MDEKKYINYKINRKEFRVNKSQNLLTIEGENKLYCFNDLEISKIFKKSIKELIEFYNGVGVKQYYEYTNKYDGYKLFDSRKKEFQEGNIVEDIESDHGLYFTYYKEDLFELLLMNQGEMYGDSLAKISFKKPDGSFVQNPSIIFLGGSVPGECRAKRFYIKEVQSLNDCNLIYDLFKCTGKKTKQLMLREDEGGFYRESVKYYKEKGCIETVRALNEIHIMYKKMMCD